MNFNILKLAGSVVLVILVMDCGKSENTREIVLYAAREAPIGGETVTLFRDSVIQFETVALRETLKYEGRFSISGDTIHITYSKQDSIQRENYLVIQGSELKRERSRAFKIGINNLKK